VLLHPFGELDQRYLLQHEGEEDGPDDSKDDGEEELVKTGAEQEGDHLGRYLLGLVFHQQL